MKHFLEFCTEILGAAVCILLTAGCIFLLWVMANSALKYHSAKQCSESGGIPVEVANYIHCHER